MFRVISVRSLKFSDEGKQKPQDAPTTCQVLMRRADDNGQTQLCAPSNKTANDALSDPSVVGDLIRDQAKKSKRQMHGVWSSYDQTYQPLGDPHLDLNVDLVRDKQDFISTQGLPNEGTQSRQRLERLVRLLANTKQKMLSIDLGNFDSNLLNNENMTRRSSCVSNVRRSSVAVVGEPSRQASCAENAPKTPNSSSTVDRISMLGVPQPKRQAVVPAKEKKMTSSTTTELVEAKRQEYRVRWKEQFRQTCEQLDQDLITMLEERHKVRSETCHFNELLGAASVLAEADVKRLKDDASKFNLANVKKSAKNSIWDRARKSLPSLQNSHDMSPDGILRTMFGDNVLSDDSDDEDDAKRGGDTRDAELQANERLIHQVDCLLESFQSAPGFGQSKGGKSGVNLRPGSGGQQASGTSSTSALSRNRSALRLFRAQMKRSVRPVKYHYNAHAHHDDPVNLKFTDSQADGFFVKRDESLLFPPLSQTPL